jgi:hypothetical protein
MRRELERAQPRKAHRAPPTLSGRPLELIAFARTVWSRSSRSRITTNSAYASYPRGKPPKARPLTLRLYHRAWAPQRMPRTARQNDRNPLQERVSVCQSRSGRWDSNPRPSAWEADHTASSASQRFAPVTRFPWAGAAFRRCRTDRFPVIRRRFQRLPLLPGYSRDGRWRPCLAAAPVPVQTTPPRSRNGAHRSHPGRRPLRRPRGRARSAVRPKTSTATTNPVASALKSSSRDILASRSHSRD